MTENSNASKSLEVQEKEALDVKEEQTVEGNFYRPLTDIFETAEALTVVMEVPGVDRDDIEVRLDQGQLTVMARIGLERYGELQPLYTEYDIGHFTRTFQLSNLVAQDKISARVSDGVLTLTLPKVEEATPRKIKVS